MTRITNNTVYTVFHFVRKNEDFQFAGFQGVFSSKEKAEESIFSTSKIKDDENHYLSKDGTHMWEINADIIR